MEIAGFFLEVVKKSKITERNILLILSIVNRSKEHMQKKLWKLTRSSEEMLS